VIVFARMAVFWVALGLVVGTLLTVARTSGACAVVLILTIVGGAWFDLEAIGGVFLGLGDLLLFQHALDASRAVLADGAGFADVAADLGWVAGHAATATVVAVASFQRRTRI
jgi:hypothetical protein